MDYTPEQLNIAVNHIAEYGNTFLDHEKIKFKLEYELAGFREPKSLGNLKYVAAVCYDVSLDGL